MTREEPLTLVGTVTAASSAALADLPMQAHARTVALQQQAGNKYKTQQ